MYAGSGDLIKKLFAEKVEGYFKPLLVGKTIESRGDVLVNSYIETHIKVENMEFLMHYRLSSEEEGMESVEIAVEGEITLAEYFDSSVKGQKIEKVIFECTDRDELYLICKLENGCTVEITMGFNLFYGPLGKILTTEDRDCYRILYYITKSVIRYSEDLSFRMKSWRYLEILRALGLERKFKYELSDFYKFGKINRLIKGEIKNAAETIAEIERIIYL